MQMSQEDSVCVESYVWYQRIQSAYVEQLDTLEVSSFDGSYSTFRLLRLKLQVKILTENSYFISSNV